MITFLKNQKIIVSFVALLFVFHWFSKDIRDPYGRPVVGDAQAYYSYLPAIFIYGDMDYSFMQTEAAKHYPEGYIKDFVKDVDGQKVNKTFPGVAVLYMPFFALAHTSALLFGLEADGFSTIYQFWFDIGHWFYFLFGLIFLKKFLEKCGFSSKNALLSTILTGIGTNLFFYTVYDQSVTHVHNFCMINAMLFCLALWREQDKDKWLIIAFVLLALIGITRPTNILVFGLIFFFFHQKSFYLDLFRFVFSKKALKIALFVLPVLALPFVLWKVQTGKWIVYSYGEEGFDFSDPHLLEFIFSYTKGWLTYTPIAVIILLGGFYVLFRKDAKQATVGIFFYLVSIYVFSSWWCWYYGAGMSQRVMIDHYVLLAFLLATVLKALHEKPVLRSGFISLCVLLTVVNVGQAWQINNGVLQNGSATQEQYWENFLVFEKRARVYPKEHWVYNKDPLMWSTQLSVDQQQQYSQTLSGGIGTLHEGHKLILSFESYAENNVTETRAVILFSRKENQETEDPFVFFIKEFSQQNEWVLMEFLIEPLREYQGNVKIFFWNAGTDETVKIRNVKLETYYTDEYM